MSKSRTTSRAQVRRRHVPANRSGLCYAVLHRPVADMDEISHTASSDSRSVPLVVRSHGATDCGRLRPTNEDQFLIADLTKAMNVRQTSLEEARAKFGEQHGHLFLVADGMGGHHAGEHASALAVTLIEQFALNTFRWFMPLTAAHADSAVTDFQEAVEQADATIVEAATKRADLHGMGTTLTLAFHYEAELLVIHVGDSRAYLFRDETLRQLTRDHTVVAEMVHRGELDMAEARVHRLRHVITNVVGGTEAGVQAEAHSLELRVDDELLLCSDGLTEMLSHAEISEVLRGEPGPEAACTRLISLANERGGRDNITAIVARFSAVPPTTGNATGNE